MISFQITDSPDLNVIKSFTFFQNLIYLGRKRGNLCIDDPKLLEGHLMIEVIGPILQVHPQTHVDHYLLNEKRATEIRKLKIGDTLTIGETRLKILNFQETKEESKKDFLNRKMSELMASNSPKLELIEKLAQLSKQDV
jgi:hypothetical protein